MPLDIEAGTSEMEQGLMERCRQVAIAGHPEDIAQALFNLVMSVLHAPAAAAYTGRRIKCPHGCSTLDPHRRQCCGHGFPWNEYPSA